MITEEEYEKALLIIFQYTQERSEAKIAANYENGLSFEESHPVADKGDIIEITKELRKRDSKYLKVGGRFKVRFMDAPYRCFCVPLEGTRGLSLWSHDYDWKIVDKAD